MKKVIFAVLLLTSMNSHAFRIEFSPAFNRNSENTEDRFESSYSNHAKLNTTTKKTSNRNLKSCDDTSVDVGEECLPIRYIKGSKLVASEQNKIKAEMISSDNLTIEGNEPLGNRRKTNNEKVNLTLNQMLEHTRLSTTVSYRKNINGKPITNCSKRLMMKHLAKFTRRNIKRVGAAFEALESGSVDAVQCAILYDGYKYDGDITQNDFIYYAGVFAALYSMETGSKFSYKAANVLLPFSANVDDPFLLELNK